MGRWLGVLLAETGSTTDPATLHYDYIDVETTANVIQLAKQSFWWGTNSFLFVYFFLSDFQMVGLLVMCYFIKIRFTEHYSAFFNVFILLLCPF